MDDPRISGEHARLSWTGDHWELRDLGSRNGTFVQGRKLEPGERVVLTRGSVFTLGGLGMRWVLDDASPPGPSARVQGTSMWVAGDRGILVLPDPDSAIVTVFQDRQGTWMLESPDESYPVRSGQAITVQGLVWTLDLPLYLPPTWVDERTSDPSFEDIELFFRVSLDEEHVELGYSHRGHDTMLPARAYHYMLLTLARMRLDQADLPDSECGWVHRDQLCRMLGVDANKLNVDVYRARREFSSFAVGGAGVVERRGSTGEVRFGTERVRVESL